MISAPILGTYSSSMLNDVQQKWSPGVITLCTNLIHFLLPRWFRIGHSQVITWNDEYTGARLPPLHTICISGKWAHAPHHVSLERHTGAACLSAARVRLPFGSQGVPTHVRKKKKLYDKKKKQKKNPIYITLRSSCDPLLQQRNVWAFIIKTSSFSIASYVNKKYSVSMEKG